MSPFCSMWNFLKRFNWSLLSVLWLAVIFFLLLFDGSSLDVEHPKLFLHADKIIHAGLFGIWSFCLSFASLQRFSRIRFLPIIVAIFFVAISTELVQGLTTYRSSDYWDVLADIAGGGIGLSFFNFFLKK